MRVTFHKHLAIATIILAFAFTCYGVSVSEPNKPSAEKASPREVSAHAQKDSDAIRAAKAELRAEMYKDSTDSLKWALGIIIGLVIIFIGYATFKSTREYRQALADVKEALSQARQATKEARDASDRAREYEEKAQERLVSIDREVAAKLKEIEVRGQELITSLIQESEEQRKAGREEAEKQLKVSREQAERQRKISELSTKGTNAHQSKDYALTVDYFEQIEKIDPTNILALSNGAAALAELAKTKKGNEASNLLIQACEKCERAIKIKPNYAEAYSNWGAALMILAGTKEDDEAYGLLGQACEKCEKAIKIRSNYASAYNNWGYALAEQGKIKSDNKLFGQACEKYKKAVELRPSYFEAWNNWGGALLYNAQKKRGEEQGRLWGEAKEKCLKAESIKTGSGAYNLACVHVLLGKEKECPKWLKAGEKAGTLPTREHAMADADLKSVRNKAWFKQIRWKGE